MTEFVFDSEARIRFWIDCDTKEEAVNAFAEALSNAKELKIDVDTLQPMIVKGE
jgi:hypothetical protein